MKKSKASFQLRAGLAALIAALGLSAAPLQAAPPAPQYAFTNGKWWDGKQFQTRTMYAIDGVLHSSWNGRLDETIDLGGRYVIPPLTEVHAHWIEPKRFDNFISCYLADGIYYVRDPSSSPYVVNQLRDKVNLPNSVDMVWSLQSFNGPGGHPSNEYAKLADYGVIPMAWKNNLDPNILFIVNNKKEIDERIEMLKKERPDYVKMFLEYSEDYQKRLKDPKTYGERGIDPKLVPYVVKKVHELGLKVLAHVYTVGDYRAALYGGVDEMVHMPGVRYEPGMDKKRFLLTEEDARETKRRGVVVNPTMAYSYEYIDTNPKYAKLVRDEIFIPNLKLLKDHGVKILSGSDFYYHNVTEELARLKGSKLFTDEELLVMTTRTSSQAIFPNRKIGQLDDGYEADFLVLDRNPAENIDNINSITLRVKQGRRLVLAPEALKRPQKSCVADVY